MTKKNTRRALLMSVLSLVMCVSMLVGTTFAWFTDSVSSARNTIQSGNLDVELKYWDGDSYEDVTATTKLFNDAALWEPGYTEVAYLQVKNAGSLALKYQLSVTVFGETVGKTKSGADIKLSDYLEFKTVESDTDLADAYTRETAKSAPVTATKLKTYNSEVKALEETGDVDYVALVLYMPETVGNEANHDGANVPSIQMGVSLYATQFTYEEDSFDELYDEGTVIVSTADEAQAALDNAAAGTTIRLAPGVNYGTLYVRQNADKKVVDITALGGDAAGNEKYSRYSNLTILGDGAVVDSIVFQNGWIADITTASYLDIKNMTVKGVTFSGATTAFNLHGSALGIDGLTIEDCRMKDTGDSRFVFQQITGSKDLTDKTTGEYVMTAGVKNLTIANCEIEGAYQVIESRAMENLTIKNNVFKGITSRDMLITADTTHYPDVTYSGTVAITGNHSYEGTERFVRMAGTGAATVIIKDNVITNYMGADADYIKVTGANDGCVTIENNELVYGFSVADDAELAAALNIIKTNSNFYNKEITITMAAGNYSGDHAIAQYPQWSGVVGAGGTGNNYAGGVPADAPVTHLTFVGADGAAFTGNVTVNGFGNAGTGFASARATTTFRNVIFDAADSADEEDASDAVAMYVKAGANNVTFDRCIFKNATHVVLGGGAADGIGRVDLKGCTFNNGGCLSGYVETLNVSDTTVTAADNGFINKSKAGNVTVTGSTIRAGRYFLRTANAGVHLTATGNTIEVYESEGTAYLVCFRGSNESATFSGGSIAAGYTTKGVDADSTLTIN